MNLEKGTQQLPDTRKGPKDHGQCLCTKIYQHRLLVKFYFITQAMVPFFGKEERLQIYATLTAAQTLDESEMDMLIDDKGQNYISNQSCLAK